MKGQNRFILTYYTMLHYYNYLDSNMAVIFGDCHKHRNQIVS